MAIQEVILLSISYVKNEGLGAEGKRGVFRVSGSGKAEKSDILEKNKRLFSHGPTQTNTDILPVDLTDKIESSLREALVIKLFPRIENKKGSGVKSSFALTLFFRTSLLLWAGHSIPLYSSLSPARLKI
jgi:hypothetical protein